jgi:hypothetical protein
MARSWGTLSVVAAWALCVWISAAWKYAEIRKRLGSDNVGTYQTETRCCAGAPSERYTSPDVDQLSLILTLRGKPVVELLLDKLVRVQQILANLGMDDAAQVFSKL